MDSFSPYCVPTMKKLIDFVLFPYKLFLLLVATETEVKTLQN